MTAGRYHLTLFSGDRPMMHGWWRREATARDMLPVWVGKWGTLSDARVTLVDEETGETLTTWPDEA
ncbi:hypothetical protein AB0D78_28025 [Streptomyces avermitilis]|uniref:hypothetical protein n=1 Tax=Streptomyces avermitilis TaxID=33903 RepID=UPI0033F980EF